MKIVKFFFKAMAAVIGLCFLLVVIVAISGKRPAPMAPQTTALASSQPESALTMANFNRVRSGMTYSQVVAILGDSGEEMSRVDLAGTTTVMYVWKRWSGANMNAMFQNGRLISKAQFGL
jgi:hypothetical protein